MLHPSVISYTGHGNAAGNREVRFTFETRPDPSLRFLQGGVAWALEDRLTRITTYVDAVPVKNYKLVYSTAQFSQLERTFECEGDTDLRCKLPTSFTYERSPGFDVVRPGPGVVGPGGQLDVNGDGLPDFLQTEVTVEGIDANPELVAAQIATDVVIGVGSNFLTPAVGMPIGAIWNMWSPVFWGLFADEPEVKVEHFIQLNTGVRGRDSFIPDETTGIPCEFANSFLDWEKDGWDDVMSACPDRSDFKLRVGHSLGDGRFSAGGTVLTTKRRITHGAGRNQRTTELRPPVLFDVDGDSLQDIVYCKDDCSMELRRRQGPDDNFSGAIPIEPPSCGPKKDHRGRTIGREGDPEPFCTRGGQSGRRRRNARLHCDGVGSVVSRLDHPMTESASSSPRASSTAAW